MLTTQEAINILLSFDLQDSAICTRVPFSVEVNAVFIVDLNKLKSPKDILCDDMGVWNWGGSTKRWISVDKHGFVTFLKNKPESVSSNIYRVWKRYYALKSSPDVKRMIIVLEGMSIPMCMCMYQ